MFYDVPTFYNVCPLHINKGYVHIQKLEKLFNSFHKVKTFIFDILERFSECHWTICIFTSFFNGKTYDLETFSTLALLYFVSDWSFTSSPILTPWLVLQTSDSRNILITVRILGTQVVDVSFSFTF